MPLHPSMTWFVDDGGLPTGLKQFFSHCCLFAMSVAGRTDIGHRMFEKVTSAVATCQTGPSSFASNRHLANPIGKLHGQGTSTACGPAVLSAHRKCSRQAGDVSHLLSSARPPPLHSGFLCSRDTLRAEQAT